MQSVQSNWQSVLNETRLHQYHEKQNRHERNPDVPDFGMFAIFHARILVNPYIYGVSLDEWIGH